MTSLSKASLAARTGVAKPSGAIGGGCWAEKRIYTGSLLPCFAGCGNAPRRGTLTCHAHADREDAAQELRRTLDSTKVKSVPDKRDS